MTLRRALRVLAALAFLAHGSTAAAGGDAPESADSAALRELAARLAPSIVHLEVVVREELENGISLDTEREATGLVVAGGGLILAPALLLPAGRPPRAQVAHAEALVAGGERFQARWLGAGDGGAAERLTLFEVADERFPGVPVEFAADDHLEVGAFIASLRIAGPNFSHVPYLDAFLVSGALPEPERCYLTTFAVSDYLGGPVAALDGRVVGVVGQARLGGAARAASASPFAARAGEAEDGLEIVLLPAARVRACIERRHGGDAKAAARRRPSWIGIETQPALAEHLAVLGLAEQEGGVLVTRVLPDSPAERAGLAVHDLLVQWNGAALGAAGESAGAHLARLLRDAGPGSQVALAFYRAGHPLTAELTLAAAPLAAGEAERARSTSFGVEARDLVHEDRADQRLGGGFLGARLTMVRRTGFCGQAGLEAGDIVSEVDGRPLAGAAELCTLLDGAAEERRAALTLFVHRGFDTLFVEVTPDWQGSRRHE